MNEEDLQGIPRGFITTSALKKLKIKTGDRPEDVTTLHNMGYTARKLKDRVHKGDFIYGVHYQDTRPRCSEVPVYTWNIRAIARLWQTPPEHRNPFLESGDRQKTSNRKRVLQIA